MHTSYLLGLMKARAHVQDNSRMIATMTAMQTSYLLGLMKAFPLLLKKTCFSMAWAAKSVEAK